jgi:CxxC motif-containing protein
MTPPFATYLCIGCPLGCRLEVEEEEGAIVEVRGFACKRGKEYAEQEHIDPRRMVTTTVRILNARWARLPVRTTTSVPKDRVRAVCQALSRIAVNTPVHMGDVILRNVLDTGADVVASRNMPTGNEPEPPQD